MQTGKKLSAVVLLSALAFGCKPANNHLAESAQRGDAVYKQYKETDYATAKAALLDYINYLDALAQSDPRMGQMCETDAMTSYVRLAKLEEMNRGADKDRYMILATQRCGRLSIKRNCSPESLRSMVDGIDTTPAK